MEVLMFNCSDWTLILWLDKIEVSSQNVFYVKIIIKIYTDEANRYETSTHRLLLSLRDGGLLGVELVVIVRARLVGMSSSLFSGGRITMSLAASSVNSEHGNQHYKEQCSQWAITYIFPFQSPAVHFTGYSAAWILLQIFVLMPWHRVFHRKRLVIT